MNQPLPTSAITRSGPGEVRHLFAGTAALLALAALIALWDPQPSNRDRVQHAAVFGGLLVVLLGVAVYDAWRGRLARRLEALPPSTSAWPAATTVLSVLVVIGVVLTVVDLRKRTSHVTDLAAY